MADWTAAERLQPSLLDRLTDQDRSSSSEPVAARVLTRQQLRSAVLRDLGWLLNANRAEPSESHPRVTRAAYLDEQVLLWEQVPQARHSVLNYGLASLSGSNIGRLNLKVVAADIKKAIVDFEPRIDPKTLVVEAEINGGAMSHHNQIKILIKGQMWNQPVPLELLLSASMDVETGQSVVSDMRS